MIFASRHAIHLASIVWLFSCYFVQAVTFNNTIPNRCFAWAKLNGGSFTYAGVIPPGGTTTFTTSGYGSGTWVYAFSTNPNESSGNLFGACTLRGTLSSGLPLLPATDGTGATIYWTAPTGTLTFNTLFGGYYYNYGAGTITITSILNPFALPINSNPSVSITAPIAGQTITNYAGALIIPVNVYAQAQSPSVVSSLAIYDGSTKVGSSVYCQIANPSPGIHTIWAQVIDSYYRISYTTNNITVVPSSATIPAGITFVNDANRLYTLISIHASISTPLGAPVLPPIGEPILPRA